MKEPRATKKKYETPVIVDLGAVARGSGKCQTGPSNIGGLCKPGNTAAPCVTGSFKA